MRRTLIGSTVLLAAALVLTGCSAGAGSASDESGFAPQAPVDSGEMAGGDGGSIAAEDGAVDSDGSVDSPSAERQVIITGNVTITADDPLAASKEAVKIVEAAGGRIDGRTEYAAGDGDNGSAQLELRIPADKLTAVLDKLEELGSADEVTLSTSDVTVQVQDLDARIGELTASIDRLKALYSQAKNIDDLIALESEISNRQAELESLQAQKRFLDDQVAMSSVSLYLRSDAEAPPKNPDTFWSGLGTGWEAFVAFWAGLLVVLGVLLPWIITLGAIAALIVFIVRRRRRRADEAAAASAQAKPRSKASSAKP